MAPTELRKAVGQSVTLHTDEGDVSGSLLSCTLESAWVVDATEHDVIVPLPHVQSFERLAS